MPIGIASDSKKNVTKLAKLIDKKPPRTIFSRSTIMKPAKKGTNPNRRG